MKRNTNVAVEYISYGSLFVFELASAPYYLIEAAYYRADRRMDSFYT